MNLIIMCLAASAQFGSTPMAPPPAVPTVPCVAQTAPMPDAGDAADDPAIWVHSTDPARSLIVGTNKKRGLVVSALDGSTVQTLDDGRMNNVDIVQAVRTRQGGTVDLALATNRTDNSLVIYRMDAASGMLARLGSIATDLPEVYGLCAFADARSGSLRAVVGAKSGRVRTFGIDIPGPDAPPQATLIGEFEVGSQAEGMVADPEFGRLYIGEERVGVWVYPLDPSADTPRVLLDAVASDFGVSGRLAADVEGIALVAGPDRSGAVLVSCQGEDRFAAYHRATGAYLGSFRLELPAREGRPADPVTHTDGIAAVGLPLGPRFPRGAVVVQDDNDGKNQNFKIASWADIARALDLPLP